MGMKIQGNDRIWGLTTAGVMLNFFIWGFQGSGPLMMLAIISSILFVLDLAVPSKYQPHLVTSFVYSSLFNHTNSGVSPCDEQES